MQTDDDTANAHTLAPPLKLPHSLKLYTGRIPERTIAGSSTRLDIQPWPLGSSGTLSPALSRESLNEKAESPIVRSQISISHSCVAGHRRLL